MGALKLTDGSATRVIPISEVCLVGRHWSCHARFFSSSVPQFWFEVRWLGQNWGWRPLNRVDETRGSGSVDKNGWRIINSLSRRVARITIDEGIVAELTDTTPPQAFAMNVENNEFVSGDALEDLYECVDDRFYRFGWEHGADASYELKDGDLVSSGTSLYRLFFPVLGAPTLVAQLHLIIDECSLRISVSELWASFESDESSVRVTGECVRVLAAYALVRRDESYTDGGWLTAPESHKQWLKLGGNTNSGIERLGFERGKLRSQLRKAGVLDVKDLFERKTSGYRTMLRLSTRADQIIFIDPEFQSDD